MRRPPVCLSIPLLLAVSLPAQEWSRFRGPNGVGIAASEPLPNEIGPDKNVLWKTSLPPGRSSPVLWGDRVFVTAFDDKSLLTICLDRRTGKILWRREAPRERVAKVDKRNGPASPTPAADADTVVVFFPDFGMLAYDHAGELRWKLPLGPFDNVYGMGASPILHGDLVFLPCDQSNNSFLVAVAKKDGKLAWKVDRPRAKSGHSTPIILQPETGPAQLVLPGSFLLDAYDTKTGKRVWWVRGLSFEMKSTPVLHAGTIYINGYGSPLNQPGRQVAVPAFADILSERDADGDGTISKKEMPRSRARMFFDFVDLDKNGQLGAEDWSFLRAALASQNGMLAIKAGGRGDMTDESVAWSYRRSVPQLPSPLVQDGVLYMLNDQGGIVVLLEAETGKVIKRGRLQSAIDNYYASPVAGDGKVYFVSENGLVSVVRAGRELRALCVGDLDDRCYATPAIANGRIYLRTWSALFCFGHSEGKRR